MTAGDETESRSRNPVEAALDLAVFAPLGFALEFRRVVPELAEAGRRQVAFSRSLGQAALRTMARSAGTSAARPSATTPAPPSRTETNASPASGPTTGDPSSAKPPQQPEEAIDGYDGLTARDIIALCGAASGAQLRWMRRREQSGKQRKTVLAAIERAV